ncbi:loricrin, putative [Trichomonas vaginalis G3]|uniref:receptor protein-tyrosine kinase n=1 Tax=Trichomonas vaginalis (strain ATCC PRA-98 / G3) TaxID=412133 RepID=A2EJH3_TRIV3|nr:glycine-rich protein family [Trichomonas vaginalis G3]EAY07230.1 loricrin, putative [Trichomonas vaginalis G3]KAI5533918.1 glycine-rich protein family [Trichomonas vaginalis G3]|eukprot:XP_001319453.1 loricrin [Trichomonas vaginalis G3]
MALLYLLQSPEKGQLNVTISDEKEYTFNYPCESLFECTPYIVTFSPGYYTLETWGAQGGSYHNGNGGKGGYSRGTIFLKQATNGFLYIGGQGTANHTEGPQNGGYNGGGHGHFSSPSYGSGGGGGTDIRLLSNTLYHRIIVSGGGGGSGFGYAFTKNYYATHNTGGYGGGDKGADSTTNPSYRGFESYGGNQTNPGGVNLEKEKTIPTEFGLGGSNTGGAGGYSSPGGGGGWYEGGAPGGLGFGAAGGSGYLLTENSYKPPGYKLGPDYYLTNTLSLNDTRAGNGMIKITIVKLTGWQIKNCKFYCSNCFSLSPVLSYVLSFAILFDFS